MGREAIRQVAVQYFRDAELPYVGTVFAGRPLVVDEDDYDIQMFAGLFDDINSIEGSSAVLIVDIPKSHRERMTLTGRSHQDDTNVHSMVLELFLANTSGDGIAAQKDHDRICDAIVAAVRQDPLLGQPQTVWSAGEFSVGVDVQQREPLTNSDGTAIFIPGDITFETWEWIAESNT